MRPLNQASVLKELEGVAKKLNEDAMAPEKRLVLLRRQAQLGDLRDAIAERGRRAAS